MRYLLVVGFACDVYRREPRARIFVGDQLVDDFHIPHTTDNLTVARTYFDNHHILQPHSDLDTTNILIKNNPPLKFYEVDIDEKIKNLTVRINIDNSDSNYSNGFITKSTLIKLKAFYFFPYNKKVLIRLKEIKFKSRNSKNYAWYRSAKNSIFDLSENVWWQAVNGNRLTNQSYKYGHVLRGTKIGENGDFFCQLVKKYGFFISKLSRSYRHFFHDRMILYLFDKYFHHANQRNNN